MTHTAFHIISIVAWVLSLLISQASLAIGTVNLKGLNPEISVKAVDYCPEDKLQFLKDSLISAIELSDGVPLSFSLVATQQLREEKVHESDFIFADPSTAAGLIRYSGYRPLFAITNNGYSGPADQTTAATILVKKSDTRFFSIKSLKGATFLVNDLNEVPVETLLIADAKNQGLNPISLLSKKRAYRESLLASVRRFLAGNFDALLIPACEFESLDSSIQEQLRVIEARLYDNLACEHSTQTGPSWLFLASTRATTEQINWIRQRFLPQKLNNSQYVWRKYEDAQKLLDIMFSGTDSFFEKFRRFSIKELIEENLEVVFSILSTIAAILLWAVFATLKIARDRAEMLATNEKLGNLERVSIVGQMSSIVAHELRQPIFAIRNYASSLKRRKANGNLTDDSLNWAINRIVEESSRANDIIEHVRNYAKGGDSIIREKANISRALNQIIDEISRKLKFAGSIRTDIEPNIEFKFDLLEVALIVRNLVNNATEALKDVPNAQISIHMHTEYLLDKTQKLIIEVRDNGKTVTEELISRLGSPITSQKTSGLGLGLSIVTRVVENWGGRLSFSINPPSGLTARIEITEENDRTTGTSDSLPNQSS